MYTYRYKHYRSNHENFTELLDRLIKAGADVPSRCQAMTICVIESIDTRRQMGVGASFCSDKDQFSKRKGREIALKRAEHNKALRGMVVETPTNE